MQCILLLPSCRDSVPLLVPYVDVFMTFHTLVLGFWLFWYSIHYLNFREQSLQFLFLRCILCL